jgi:ATP phosphoribosyltransferase regulatory subunit HisZ
MPNNIRNKLAIKNRRLDEINAFLKDPNNKLVNNLLSVIEKYGGPEEIKKLENQVN